MTVAGHRSVPADDMLRELLAEMIRVSGLIRRADTNLNQAVARLNATGQPGPDLAPAAAWVTRVAHQVDEASLTISHRLGQQHRH